MGTAKRKNSKLVTALLIYSIIAFALAGINGMIFRRIRWYQQMSHNYYMQSENKLRIEELKAECEDLRKAIEALGGRADEREQ